MSYSKDFVTNISNIKNAYNSCPYCFKALKEYYANKANIIRDVISNVDTDEPATNVRKARDTEVDELITYTDRMTGKVMAVKASVIQLAVTADSDIEAGLLGVYDLSTNIAVATTTRASNIVQSLLDDHVDASVLEEFYDNLSQLAMDEAPKVNDFIDKIKTKFGSLQIPTIAAPYVEILKNSSNPCEAFACLNAVSVPQSLVFNYDDYEANVNPFFTAVTEIVDDVSKVVAAAFKGINSLSDLVKSIGQAAGNLLSWLIKKTAGQLLVDFTKQNYGNGALDVPIMSCYFSSLGVLKDRIFGINTVSFTPFNIYAISNNMYGRTSFNINSNTIQIIDDLEQKLQETNFVEFAIPSGIIRIFLQDGKYYFYLYATGNRLTDNDENNFIFQLSNKFVNVDTESNESFGSLFIESIHHCMGSILSLPCELSDSSVYTYRYQLNTSSDFVTDIIDITKYDYTDSQLNGSANLVDGIKYKHVNGDNLTSSDLVAKIVRGMLMHYSFIHYMNNIDKSSIGNYFGIVSDTESSYTLNTLISGEWNNTFYPYYTYNATNFDIHAQTTAEQVKEIKIAIIAIIVAIAVIAITVKVVKTKKKWKMKSFTKAQEAYNAWDDAAKETDPSAKLSLMRKAYKVQRKSDRYKKIASLIGAVALDDVTSSYTNNNYENSSESMISTIYETITGDGLY